jgi:hypothetical protein
MAKINTSAKATNGKKVMKTETPKPAPDFGAMRKLFTSILTKVKGLTLVENAHGAIQIKDGRGLLFSARSDGNMIITHPMYEGKGKDKKRVFQIAGGKWDDLSEVPFDKVTAEMLLTRANDPKSRAQYHAELYKGREDEAGLVKKLAAAKARMAKATTEASGKKAKVTALKREAKKVEVDKKATRKPVKAIRTAVQAVAGK